MQRPAISEAAIVRLNAVPVSAEQLEDALVLTRTVSKFRLTKAGERLGDTDVASAALRARLVALDRWHAMTGRSHAVDEHFILEAAAHCRLVAGSDGPAFDHERFAELVALSTDVPF